jgi:hypothetical protein
MLYGISNVGHLKGIVVDPLLEVRPHCGRAPNGPDKVG